MSNSNQSNQFNVSNVSNVSRETIRTPSSYKMCDVVFVWVGDNGHFKLVNTKTKEETQVAGYRQIAYLDGFVGSTGYYGIEEGVMPANEWLELNAVTKK